MIAIRAFVIYLEYVIEQIGVVVIKILFILQITPKILQIVTRNPVNVEMEIIFRFIS